MKHRSVITRTGLLLGLITASLLSGCLVATPRGGYRDDDRRGYREGYWDRAHHRYWHEHGWVACGPADVHCR